MKKLRLKKKYRRLLIIIIFVLVLVLIIPNLKNKKTLNRKKEESDIVSLVYKKLGKENISKDFLIYVDNNYKGSLKKLNSLVYNYQLKVQQ